MKVVAVSQRVDFYPKRNEVRDALDRRLIALLLDAGFSPVPVPNALVSVPVSAQLGRENFNIWLAAIKPDALLLSGGNDIGESIERDLTEIRLLEYAMLRNLPVLGICRGMQVMAHSAGTTLCVAQKHLGTRHQLFGEIQGEVNSYHMYSLACCPDNFRILARSEDGEIEAIRHQSLPWEGWMWHPERESPFSSRDIQRLQELFK